MSNGEFIGDATRLIIGEFDAGRRGDTYTYGAFRLYASNKATAAVEGTSGWVLQFNNSMVVPTALENRPASISSNLYMKY
jgi:hypothetical protein